MEQLFTSLDGGAWYRISIQFDSIHSPPALLLVTLLEVSGCRTDGLEAIPQKNSGQILCFRCSSSLFALGHGNCAEMKLLSHTRLGRTRRHGLSELQEMRRTALLTGRLSLLNCGKERSGATAECVLKCRLGSQWQQRHENRAQCAVCVHKVSFMCYSATAFYTYIFMLMYTVAHSSQIVVVTQLNSPSSRCPGTNSAAAAFAPGGRGRRRARWRI